MENNPQYKPQIHRLHVYGLHLKPHCGSSNHFTSGGWTFLFLHAEKWSIRPIFVAIRHDGISNG